MAKSKYDTFALEASYLAQGQQQRIAEKQLQLQQLKKILKSIQRGNVAEAFEIGSLITLFCEDNKQKRCFFILPCAGGFSCQSDKIKAQVISPDAPIANIIMHKGEGEPIQLQNQNWIIDQIH